MLDAHRGQLLVLCQFGSDCGIITRSSCARPPTDAVFANSIIGHDIGVADLSGLSELSEWYSPTRCDAGVGIV